ncbi:MAG: type I-MYXAN CRISPR-associated protein Cas6/Cmx6, partial [Kofleriaceae bacterium]|nr:type I-MYXAN CRISPR-associated protein Cas6/Cmx6 [Kofleriaceae bacterium]
KSVLRLRIPAKEVGILFPLVGAQIQLAGKSLSLGELTLKPSLPKPTLWAKFVTLKGHTQAQSFHDKLREQLCAIEKLGQDPAQVELLIAHRKVMRIHDKKVVGFRVITQGLNAQASIRLQEVGLGGRRHMGAGLFIPKNK